MTDITWDSPGAMADHDAYYNDYYLEVWTLDPDGKTIGYRWEVRREDDWLDPEPLDYGIVSNLEQAKNDAQGACI